MPVCPACKSDNEPGIERCTNCNSSMALGEGDMIAGRYEIRSVLGEGGMGLVYKAYDRVLDEDVAMKILRPGFTVTAELERRFRSEIKLARKVSHRNVCRIHEYGDDKGMRYLSMEYIDGDSLKQMVRGKGGLPLEQALDLAIQVCKGLQAIHDVGVIHRDLKTANIMVDGKGVVRLMDFGIAKQREEQGDGVTATGEIVGTPEYMSPEQARNQKLDFRSDIYAFGILFFEILTGRLPFRGETPLDTLVMQVKEPPPLEGNVPEPVIPALRRALAKKPADRYASARGMISDLRAVQDSLLPGAPNADSAELSGGLAPIPSGIVPAAPKARRPTPPPLGRLKTDDTLTVRVRELAEQLKAENPSDRMNAAVELYQLGPAAVDALPDLRGAMADEAAAVADIAAQAYNRIVAGTEAQPEGRESLGTEAVPLDRLFVAPEPELPDLPPLPPAPAAPPPALAGLVKALRSHDSLERWRATLGLAALGAAGFEALPDLCDALEDSDTMVRTSAAAAIGKMGAAAREAVPALTAALRDRKNVSVHKAAALALAQLGPAAADAVPGLIGALQDADEAVAAAVSNALVAVGRPAVPALLEALRDDEQQVRLLAAEVLNRIASGRPS